MTSSSTSPKPTPVIWWFLPVILSGLIHWWLLPRQPVFLNDANFYLGGAISLVEGTGYRMEPYLGLPAISSYPPLHSAWLALFVWWGGGFPASSPWLVAGMEILALGSLTFLALGLRREGLPLWFGGLCVLLLGTSVVWLVLTSLLFSDVAFTMLGAAIFWWTGHKPAGSTGRVSWWFVLGSVLGLMVLERSAGIALIGGVSLLWLLDRDARSVRQGLTFFVPLAVAMWVKYSATGDTGTYGSYFWSRFEELGGWKGYAGQVMENTWDYVNGRCWTDGLLNAVFRVSGWAENRGAFAQGLSLVSEIIALAVTSLILLGAWRQRGRSLTRAALVVLLPYGAMLALWPFGLGARSVLVALPMVLVWLWHGLDSLPFAPGKKRWVRAAVGVFLVVNVAGNFELTRRESRNMVKVGSRELDDIRALADWLRKTAPPEVFVSASRDIPVNHLRQYLGRRLLNYPTPEVSPDRFYDVLPSAQGDHITDYAVFRTGAFLTYGKHKLKIEREFGAFMVCSVIKP